MKKTYVFLLIVVVLVASSCKKNYDNPAEPSSLAGEWNMTVTTTYGDLYSGSGEILITSDYKLSGQINCTQSYPKQEFIITIKGIIAPNGELQQGDWNGYGEISGKFYYTEGNGTWDSHGINRGTWKATKK